MAFSSTQGRGRNFLTFGTGLLMSSNFLRPPNKQTNFFRKTPNNLLSFLAAQNFQTESTFMRIWRHKTPNNLAYPKHFRLKISPFGTSYFQTPNTLAYPKFQTPNKHISTLFSKSRSYPPGFLNLRLSSILRLLRAEKVENTCFHIKYSLNDLCCVSGNTTVIKRARYHS